MVSSKYPLNSNTVASQIVKTTILLLKSLSGKEEEDNRSMILLLKVQT